MRPLRLCARYKRIRRHGKCKQQQEKSCHPLSAYLPLSLCLSFPFAVVGNCFRFPVEWKFAKLTNDCYCVCVRVGECVCVSVRNGKRSLYIRKCAKIQQYFDSFALQRRCPKGFFVLRLPRLKFHLNSYLMLQMLCGQWAW